MSLCRWFAVVLGVSAIARSAYADAPEGDAAAERLFQEAKGLMAEGRIHDACATLERAKRIELGGGIVLALAVCHEKEGRTASALADFREALALAIEAHRADRVRLAEERIAALRDAVSTLTLVVPDGASARVNGEIWDRARLGVAVPLDGGDYLVRVEAPEKRPWETTLHVEPQHDAQTLEIPRLADMPKPAAPAPVIAPPPQREEHTAPPAQAVRTSPNDTQRTAGLIVGGVGVASLATAGGFAILAAAKRSEADCGGHLCDGAGGTYDTARTASTIATITAIAGGVALITGGVLLFTARPHDDAPARPSAQLVPLIAPGSAALGVVGRF